MPVVVMINLPCSPKQNLDRWYGRNKVKTAFEKNQDMKSLRGSLELLYLEKYQI